MKHKLAYFDYAATTPLDPRVLEVVVASLADPDLQGNPSSLHESGRRAKDALDAARTSVARTLGVDAPEILFTGSGTESDNLAILGAARAYKERGRHIVISQIEHKAVMEAAHLLEKEGFSISYAPVSRKGTVDVDQVIGLMRHDTILVSVMLVNNEMGAIQPLQELGQRLRVFRNGRELPLLHTDACQAPCIMRVRPRELGVDLLSLNSGKIYGPKGIGCLWMRKGVRVTPCIVGGSQELGLRAGTENAALALGFAEALRIAQENPEAESERLKRMNDVVRQACGHIKHCFFNSPDDASPAVLNVSFAGTEGESLLLDLDARGICCSTGSACAATDLKPSYVLLAMGLPEELAHASLRFSFGRNTSDDDLKRLVDALPVSVERIRSVCPPIYTSIKA